VSIDHTLWIIEKWIIERFDVSIKYGRTMKGFLDVKVDYGKPSRGIAAVVGLISFIVRYIIGTRLQPINTKLKDIEDSLKNIDNNIKHVTNRVEECNRRIDGVYRVITSRHPREE
jgi:hypothetical protein